MSTERQRARCRDRLDRLSGSACDIDELRLEAIVELQRTIGFGRWSTLLMDPDTLALNRAIGHQDRDFYTRLPDLVVLDARLDDVNNSGVLARSRDRVGVLSAATGGDLARSRRWRQHYAHYGMGDELRAVLADERGCWGTVQVFRDNDDPTYDPEDAQLLRDVGPMIARALRRGAVAPADPERATPTETGVVLLGDDLRPHGVTDPGRAWLEVLDPARMPYTDRIPAPVWSVAGRLLAAEHGEDPQRPARARVRAADGRWAVLEAARLTGAGGGIAVTIRPAAVDDLLDVVCRAHGLSARERQLVALLADGLDTRAIAARLFISRHTVQDHCKSIFEKTGVRSRRELVSGVLAGPSP